MIRVTDGLIGVTRLGFDTTPIIYFIEANVSYDRLVTKIFQHVADGDIFGITSVISLVEVLVQPIRLQDVYLQNQYREFLLLSTNFETIDIDSKIAEHAAKLRSQYNLRTPDAIQLSVALQTGCQAFLTNDVRLKRISELRILIIDELEL